MPLAPRDIELLRRASASSRAGPATLVFCSIALVVCSVLLLFMARELATFPDMALAARALALLVLLLAPVVFWLGRRRDRKGTAFFDAAIAHGRKFVVQGRLQDAELLPPHRIRYTIDGQTLDAMPLLGLDTRSSCPAGRSLVSFRALANTPVELHCIAWNPGTWLLLQAHYPAARRAARKQRAALTADRRRAGFADRRFMTIVAAGLSALVLVIAWQSGFDATMTGFIAGYMALVWVAVLAFGAVPGWIRARRHLVLHTVSGPVTEICTARVPTGRRLVEASWYRIDGQLFPTFDVDGSALLGNQVTVEFLGGEHSEDGGRVVALQRQARGIGA
ncbi:MAG: hypothetical protein ABWZ88_18995 [Variovorax sp.]